MQPIAGRTAYAGLRRRPAVVLIATALLAVACTLTASLRPVRDDSGPGQGGQDLELYQRIIERVHNGQSYYDAAGAELREGGYPSASVFNWRVPIYAWLLACFPNPLWGKGFLCALAVAAIVATFTILERTGRVMRAFGGALLMVGAFLWCLDGDAYLSQELWASVLLTLSLCAYMLGSWPVGYGLGMAGLFFRELALPYCMIACVIAACEKRWQEVVFWAVGFCGFVLFLAWHAQQVAHHVIPGARVPASWVQFGGLRFVLATNHMNWFLFSAPAWVGAVYLPLAFLGLGAWSGITRWRLLLSTGIYLAAFLVVGQPFNDYWGLLYTPYLVFGAAYAPAALRDLVQAARSRTDQCEIPDAGSSAPAVQ
jgi:hypothetical protein